jgi:glycosyltransferase involved in cell wall biosynthesis
MRAWESEKPAYLHVHNMFPTLGPAFLRWVISHQIPLAMTVHNHRFFCTNGLALRNETECKACFNSSIAWRPLVYNCNSSWRKSAYHSIAMTEMRVQDLYRRAVRKFVAPSPYIQDELVRWGVSEKQVVNILNPVENGPEPMMPEKFRFDVLFAGRLSREKGLRELISAFEELPQLRLGIVGDGPERSWIESRIKKGAHIELLGSVARQSVLNHIRESRVGVLPSICNEILPTFVLECFSQGRRCVMSNQKSLRWLSQNDFPGMNVEVSNPKLFAQAILKGVQESLPDASATDRLRKRFEMNRFVEELRSFSREMGVAG